MGGGQGRGSFPRSYWPLRYSLNCWDRIALLESHPSSSHALSCEQLLAICVSCTRSLAFCISSAWVSGGQETLCFFHRPLLLRLARYAFAQVCQNLWRPCGRAPLHAKFFEILWDAGEPARPAWLRCICQDFVGPASSRQYAQRQHEPTQAHLSLLASMQARQVRGETASVCWGLPRFASPSQDHRVTLSGAVELSVSFHAAMDHIGPLRSPAGRYVPLPAAAFPCRPLRNSWNCWNRIHALSCVQPA